MKTSEFISKLNDPAIVKKMSEAKSPEEAYAVAKTAGVTDSFETFVAEIRKLKSSDGELSEDNLASVAGGVELSPEQFKNALDLLKPIIDMSTSILSALLPKLGP